MDALLQDARYGARMLWRRPSLTLVAVVSLGIGIGANAAIFTIINAVLLASVPVDEPERLVRIHTIDWEAPEQLTGISYANYEDYRDNNTVFDGVLAYVNTTVNLRPEDGDPRPVSAQLVTDGYFELLGVEPLHGRTFTHEENRAATAVAVLSYGLWEQQFGADESIVGETVELAGMPFVVVGVTPPGFSGLTLGNRDLLWMPMQMRGLVLTGVLGQYIDNRRGRFVQAIGRLKEGIELEQARQEIQAIGLRLEQEFPTANGGRSGEVSRYSPISPNQHDQYNRIAALLMVVVGAVLLIACGNVANLLLARAVDREKEIGVRISLGANRVRLVRQLLTESVLLALLGAGLGVLLARWGRDMVWAYRPPFFAAGQFDLRVDSTVLLFTLGLSLATALLFGLVPSLQASRPNLRGALQEGGRRGSTGTNRALLRSGLVVAEVALALAALVGAGLFLRSMRSAQAIDPGFEAERLALFHLNLGNAGYERGRGQIFYRQLVERLEAIPGVESASIQSGNLLGGGLFHTTFPESTSLDLPAGRGLHVHDVKVTPGYFDTVGISLVAGRLLNEFDREGSAPVAVVNEATVRLFWADRDPIGQRFRRSVEDWVYEVVGVVSDARIDLGRPPQPIIYTPLEQFYESAVQVHARTRGAPSQVMAAIRAGVRELDPGLPVLALRPVAQDLERNLWAPRTGTRLLGLFGGLALALAMIGVYGVMSYSVSGRHHEIGLRYALGAGRVRVVRLVLYQGMKLVGVGVALGIVLALIATRSIQSMLWGVSAADPLTYLGVAALLALAGLLATLVPALRVTRVDPLTAMRDEH